MSRQTNVDFDFVQASPRTNELEMDLPGLAKPFGSIGWIVRQDGEVNSVRVVRTNRGVLSDSDFRRYALSVKKATECSWNGDSVVEMWNKLDEFATGQEREVRRVGDLIE